MRRHDEEARPATAEQLEAELLRVRQTAEARRADELERKRSEALHGRRLADVAEQARRADLDRAEREETAHADAELARMYRTFRAAGLRTRITSGMARSGEARALRLERLRTLNLKVLVPVLLGFAAWSTTGVHHGAARLMGVGPSAFGDPMWWALWLLEPVLIGAVVWIIIARARLAASGGRLDERAKSLMIACLGTSVLLNFSAAVPGHAVGSVAAGFGVAGAMLAHAIGPTGAAATAHLIGVVDESIAEADPWTEGGRPVPLLADMDLTLPAPRTNIEQDEDSGPGSADERPVTYWPLSREGRALLPVVSALGRVPDDAAESTQSVPAITWPLALDGRPVLPVIARPDPSPTRTGTTRRTTSDQNRRPGSKAARTARPNKGVRVPPSARKNTAKVSPRAMSDADLRERRDALVTSGELAADASTRAVQSALGIGFARAKRVQEMTAPQTADKPAPPGRVAVMDDDETGQEQDEQAA